MSTRTNQITGSGFSYDAAGNLTADGTGTRTHTYQWDAEGRLKALDGGSSSCLYNGDGERVKRSVGANTSLYMTQGRAGRVLTEFYNGVWHQEFFYVNGELVATHENSSAWVRYYLKDHLGTPRVVVDPYGNLAGRHDYYPFGQERTAWADGETRKFTGLDRDSETGHDPTLFRQYSGNQGRWLSPDPLAGDITNPQSLNRYAYVMNNPTSLVDPLGLCIGDQCSSEGINTNPADLCAYINTGGGAECGSPPGLWPNGEPIWPGGGGGGGGAGGGGGSGGSTGTSTGGGTVGGVPGGGGVGGMPGVGNAFLGFHLLCVQAKTGPINFPGSPVTSPADCVVFFLGLRLGSLPVIGDLAAAGLVIAGSATWIVPVARVGGAGPTVQFAFSSQGWGCLGGGGALGTIGKAFNVGPILGGDLANARNVLSGWSVSTGAQSPNPSVGAQAIANSSGKIYGPTYGTPGGSLSGTVSFCGNIPW